VIQSIDGHPIRRFEGFVDSVRWGVISSEGNEIVFKVDRPGEGEKEIHVPAKAVEANDKDSAWWKGIFKRPALRTAGIMGKSVPMVGSVMPHGPADEAGLKPGDELISVDGIEMLSLYQFNEYLETKKNQPVQVVVSRKSKDGKEAVISTVTLTTRVPEVWVAEDPPKSMIGIGWHPTGERKLYYPGVGEQVSDAARSMFSMIGKLVGGKSDISVAHMSGPVGIGRVYYNLLQDPAALLQILWFSVVLNINLAIMNMLPFPVLDGGHITMAIAESIRRKPLHSRILEFVQMACALLLFGFIFFVTFKDVGDIFLGGKKQEERKIEFSPKGESPPAK
jgi:regulator of sigma E protease